MWIEVSKLRGGELFAAPIPLKTVSGRVIPKGALLLLVRSETDLTKAKDAHNISVPATLLCCVLPDGAAQCVQVFHDMQVNVQPQSEDTDE